MSTFGRKALIWWDYENRSKQNSIRFNHTPMDIQLSILEKWYPIGSNCNYIFYSQTNLSKIKKGMQNPRLTLSQFSYKGVDLD